jgi:hypothetical protein
MRTIQWLVISSSETANKTGIPVDVSVEQLRQHHLSHYGLVDVAWHFVVRFNGDVEVGRELAVVGAHAGGFNAESIGIVVTGHGDLQPFRLTQRTALGQLCARLCREFGLSPLRVIGRREIDEHGGPAFPTTSPGKLVDMATIRADVARALRLPGPALVALREASTTLAEVPPAQLVRADSYETAAPGNLAEQVRQLEERMLRVETLLDVA